MADNRIDLIRIVQAGAIKNGAAKNRPSFSPADESIKWRVGNNVSANAITLPWGLGTVHQRRSWRASLCRSLWVSTWDPLRIWRT